MQKFPQGAQIGTKQRFLFYKNFSNNLTLSVSDAGDFYNNKDIKMHFSERILHGKKNKLNSSSPAFVQGCCLYLFIFIALGIKAFIEWFSQNPFLAIIVILGVSALILYEISIFGPKNSNGRPNYTYYQQNQNNRNKNDNSDSTKKLPKR